MIALFESRLKVVFILFLILFIIISFRLVYVSIKMKELDNPFQNTIGSIQRGQIVDRDENLLAGNFLVYTVFIDPYVIKDVDDTSKKLAPFTDYDFNDLNAKIKFNKNKRYLEIAEKIDKETLDKILSLKLTGVYYRTDILREYPMSDSIAPLLGFVDKYNRGLDGLEFYYDQFLSKGDDYSIKLTIDSFMQYLLYNQLMKKGEEEEADWAIGIISEAQTGQILAVANWPSFKPDLYSTYSTEKRKNRAILNVFEPGSTFKVFVAAALLDSSNISLNNYFYCTGKFNVTENLIINDTGIHGRVNLNDILRKSCNVGIIEASMQMNSKDLYSYIRNFNFGTKTGFQYPAEPEGILKPLNKWTKMTRAIINIGQEISVSAVQLITAFNSLLNGGVLYEPCLVLEKNLKNSASEKTKPVVIRKVISEKTSQTIKQLLIDALKGDDATGKSAYTDAAIVGGKTGTAQVPYSKGKGYDPNQIYTSFLGFFEFSGNTYSIYIGFLNPKKNRYGGTASAPVFKNLVESLVAYLKIKNIKPVSISEIKNDNQVLDDLYQNALNRIINKDTVPDFTGLSLKEVVYLASKLGIKIKLKGSGFVVSQSVLPGSPISSEQVVIIELKYR
jgi:cell division protein FtsI (penicillin-binding protein 3)